MKVRKKFGYLTKRRIRYLETSLSKLEAKRDVVAKRLEALNREYDARIIGYERYLLHREAILEGKTVEQWDADYQKKKHQLKTTLRSQLHSKATSEFKSSATKALGVAITFIMVLAALAGTPLQPQITGYASDTSSFESRANITAYFAVAMSDNLGDGISFGTISAGTNNNNATDNYNNASSGSSMYMAVSSDSNVPVDFCVNADGNLTSDSNYLSLENMIWANSTSTNIDSPTISDSITMATATTKSADSITAGNNNYYRFWLDVPLSQKAGTYNNTITFTAGQTGSAC